MKQLLTLLPPSPPSGNGNLQGILLLLDTTEDLSQACQPSLIQGNKYGASPLYIALESKNFECFSFLIEYVLEHSKLPTAGGEEDTEGGEEGLEVDLRKCLSM